MKVMVTGSSGTIGTRLVQKLKEAGHNVICVDWNPNKWDEDIDLYTHNIDLRERRSVMKLPEADMVIHLAANARVYDLVVEPDLARDNFLTTYNILEWCRLNDVKKFIFASSRETYGNLNKHILKEDEARIENCESPYTASKIAGEALVHAYSQCYEIDNVILRFSNVYGMYDESDRVIPLFIKNAKEGKDLIVYGEDKLLDFTYIDDNVSGIMKCIEDFDNVKDDTYNIAQGSGNTIKELAYMIKERVNPKVKVVMKENRTGEVVKYIANIDKARAKLGYSPTTTLSDGVDKSIEWYEKNMGDYVASD